MNVHSMDDFPVGRRILIKHSVYGWIEAWFDQEVYEQSLAYPGSYHGFGWSNSGLDNWLYHRDVMAWSELPVEEPTE